MLFFRFNFIQVIKSDTKGYDLKNINLNIILTVEKRWGKKFKCCIFVSGH